MPDVNTNPPVAGMPAEVHLLQLVSGCFTSSAVYVAAKLALADLLEDGPKTAAQLAEATGTNEGALFRLLRALSSVGAFTEMGHRTFANSSVSETMRSSARNSTRDLIIWLGEEPHWRVYGELLYSVQTGKTAWDKVYGEPVFTSLIEKNKELGAIFNRAMTSYSRQTIPAILAAYDFGGVQTIADIGGGHGHLLAAILQKYPSTNGILFDIEPVLEGAPAMFESHGVAERAKMVAGDFWGAIPIQADVYLLKHIIHDWNDEQCIQILGNLRNSMPDNGRVLIIDAVLPGPNEPHFAKLLDLEMLLLPGGMERSADEFESLLKQSGFKLNRIIPTMSPIGIVEAGKA